MGFNDDIARISKNVEKAEEKVNEIEQKSLAWELLEDKKKLIHRMSIAIILLIIFSIIEFGIVLTLLIDTTRIDTSEETTTSYNMENENGINNFVGGDNSGEINNSIPKEEKNK